MHVLRILIINYRRLTIKKETFFRDKYVSEGTNLFIKASIAERKKKQSTKRLIVVLTKLN